MWQPIETAPRDGSIIVAQLSNGMIGRIKWHALDDLACAWIWIGDPDAAPKCWSDWTCWGINADGVKSAQPTHWMPIPKGPDNDTD